MCRGLRQRLGERRRRLDRRPMIGSTISRELRRMRGREKDADPPVRLPDLPPDAAFSPRYAIALCGSSR